MIWLTKMRHYIFLYFKFTNERVGDVTGNVNQFCVFVYTSTVFIDEAAGFEERPLAVTCLG